MLFLDDIKWKILWYI